MARVVNGLLKRNSVKCHSHRPFCGNALQLLIEEASPFTAGERPAWG
jgi:hypothetical protein